MVQGVFRYMTFALPVDRLRETSQVIAFHHPRPSHPVHILIVPKKGIARMTDISVDDGALLADIFQTVASIVAEFDLEQQGYRLVTNGGAYQDVQQLHFHLISGGAIDGTIGSRLWGAGGRVSSMRRGVGL
jgi:histidine triad (HIT) family protein